MIYDVRDDFGLPIVCLSFVCNIDATLLMGCQYPN